jgi:hypothetical protein
MKHGISVKSGDSWLCLAIQTKIHTQTSCLSLKQFIHFFISNHHHYEIPLSCSKELNPHHANVSCSACSITSTTDINASTLFRLHFKEHSELHKSSGGCLTKLSLANIHCAIHLITSQMAVNAVEVTKTLCNITNQSLSPSTVCLHLKKLV